MNKILNKKTTENVLIQGIETIHRLLKMTYGPKGCNVIIDSSNSELPKIYKQGSDILKELLVTDKIKNIPLLLIQESLKKVNKLAGDGSSTSFLITYLLVMNGFKNIFRELYNLEIKSGIRKTINHLITLLSEIAKPISNEKTLKNVIDRALGDNSNINELLYEAFIKVGKSGSISVESTTNSTSSLAVEQGMKFKRGYASSYFVTNTDELTAELEDPYILITTNKIGIDNSNLLELLEQIIYLKKPLLIISPEIEEETLSTLILNKLNDIIDVVYVKVPNPSAYETIFIEDISLYTKSYFFRKEYPRELQKISLTQLGRAKKIIVTKTATTIFQGNEMKKAELEKECNKLKQQISTIESNYEKDKLEDRIQNLYGINVSLKLGSLTELEIKELEKRIQTSISITKVSTYEGIIPGNGISFVNVFDELESWCKLNLNDIELIGSSLVLKAILEPIKTLLNSGLMIDGHSITSLHQLDKFYKNNTISDKNNFLIEMNLIDSLKSVVSGLQTSSSLTQILLTIDHLIVT